MEFCSFRKGDRSSGKVQTRSRVSPLGGSRASLRVGRLSGGRLNLRRNAGFSVRCAHRLSGRVRRTRKGLSPSGSSLLRPPTAPPRKRLRIAETPDTAVGTEPSVERDNPRKGIRPLRCGRGLCPGCFVQSKERVVASPLSLPGPARLQRRQECPARTRSVGLSGYAPDASLI